MKSKADSRDVHAQEDECCERNGGGESPGQSDTLDTPAEPDEPSDLDESHLGDTDDDRWDVFLLDEDDCDALPEYGDFWLPD
jgi:hypothetical protein